MSTSYYFQLLKLKQHICFRQKKKYISSYKIQIRHTIACGPERLTLSLCHKYPFWIFLVLFRFLIISAAAPHMFHIYFFHVRNMCLCKKSIPKEPLMSLNLVMGDSFSILYIYDFEILR
jgi:hypothetical protein